MLHCILLLYCKIYIVLIQCENTALRTALRARQNVDASCLFSFSFTPPLAFSLILFIARPPPPRDEPRWPLSLLNTSGLLKPPYCTCTARVESAYYFLLPVKSLYTLPSCAPHQKNQKYCTVQHHHPYLPHHLPSAASLLATGYIYIRVSLLDSTSRQ